MYYIPSIILENRKFYTKLLRIHEPGLLPESGTDHFTVLKSRHLIQRIVYAVPRSPILHGDRRRLYQAVAIPAMLSITLFQKEALAFVDLFV